MIEKTSVIHRIFGGLFGIWVGFLVNKQYPSLNLNGFIYIAYVLITVWIIASLIHFGFSRNQRKARVIIYTISLMMFGILLWGLDGLSQRAFNASPEVSLWEIGFLVFILVFWPLAIELVSWSNSNIQIRNWDPIDDNDEIKEVIRIAIAESLQENLQ
ncbi:MAG: hypothetical protein HND51_13000 [Chloroflexi bacterium]|nr:hypothetical protein [Chloroflexota bacterium]